MSFLLSLVPWYWRLGAVAALAVSSFGFGWVKSAQHSQLRIDAMVGKAVTEGVRIVTLRGAVTEKIVTKYLPQLARAQVVTETIVKEVPVYVYATDPDLPGRFRMLHDASAAGRVPDPAAIPDAAAVPAVDLAATLAANYGTCTAIAIQLRGLQEWVREQGKVK